MTRSTTLTKPIRWGESMSEFVLPTGTVTLLLADIEGSVRLWESRGPEMTKAIAKHDALVLELIGKHGGVRPKDQGEGDSFVAAFARPSEALSCALALQLAMAEEDWGGADIRLRIALHTGEVELRNEANYLGSTINRTARLRALAHGGQTLLSASTFDLVADRQPEGASIKDLGVHRLRDLSRPEHVYQLNHPELPDNFPSLRSLEALPNNLPIQLTSFVGRDKEIEEVNRLLGETRMLTLTGSGGAGKTRLALHVAADLVEEYEGGVWLVELAPVRDPSVVPAAVASAMKFAEEKEREPLETLIAHLQSRKALIILDNCEHLVNECAAIANALLHSCPTVNLIATSREPLGVDGETAWRVPSLSLPDPGGPLIVEAFTQFEAVQLFIERAIKSRPNFKITNENAPSVADICHRLDGIPLAIELAAARVRVLTPQQISEGLGDRFHLLTGGARTSMPRQQTLQASVEWSYDLLSEEEQLLLKRLSVFAGGFTLDAAEGVCSDDGLDSHEILDVLSQLIDKSLVQVDDVETSAARYHLLETIRQYAMDRLTEAGKLEEARTKHMTYFLKTAEAAIADSESNDFYQMGLTELDNFRAASRWSLSRGDLETKLRLGTICAQLLLGAGHRREALVLIDEALADSDSASPRTRSQGLLVKGWAIRWLSDGSAELALAEEALRLAQQSGDSKLADSARISIAQSALLMGDDSKLRAVADEIEESGSSEHLTMVSMQATNLWAQGELQEATALYNQVIETRRASNLGITYFTLFHLGGLLVFQGDFTLAREYFDEAAEIGSRHNVQDSRFSSMRGMLALNRGDYEEARGWFEQGIAEARAGELSLWEALAHCFNAKLLGAIGEGHEATEALEAARALGVEAGAELSPWGILAFAGSSGDVYRISGRPDLGRELLTEARARAPRPESNFGLALVALNLAKLERDEGNTEAAESLAFESLSMAHRFKAKPLVIDALEAIAGLTADQERYSEAVRLLAASQTARDQIGYVRFPVEQPTFDSALTKAREELGAEFDDHWQAGSSLSLDEVVDYALRGRGERKRPAAGWSSLTPAELRVSDLVAEGLSNPKIAERLFISRHTVETHLKNIFAKLGFTSRTQLASEVTRRRK